MACCGDSYRLGDSKGFRMHPNVSQDGGPETTLESILKIIKELNGKPTPLTSKPQLTCSEESNTAHSSVFLPEGMSG